MNPAVLIFGEAPFSEGLITLLQGGADVEVQTVDTLRGLDEAIRQNCPDLLIVQANNDQAWQWCQQFKQHPSHGGTYCLLVDCQDYPDIPWQESWRSQMQLQVKALEMGIDAFVWLSSQWSPETAVGQTQQQLLRAHVQTALRHMQRHRELSQANDLLSAIALSDALTQLGNRRALDWELPRQIRAAREQSLPLCLLMLDIDYFKTVNDTHGHLVGDQVLKILSERLRHNMRFYETPFRYGGEEFVIILNNTSAEEALQIGQRLRNIVSQQPFVVGPSLELSITISIGLSSLNEEDNTTGVSLLRRADQNLLRAKTAGRDRVIQS